MATKILLLVCISSIVILSESSSFSRDVEIDTTAYLRQYNYLPSLPKGYLEEEVALFSSDEEISAALAHFQKFAGLEVTGQMNEATYSKMKQPRCGVADVDSEMALNNRKKRYTLRGGRWKKHSLTYRIRGYNNVAHYLTRSQINRTVQKAFNVSFTFWAKVSPISFRPTRGRADIEIVFRVIDGPARILGHTFFPSSGGDSTFDSSEHWKFGFSRRGEFNFLQVATHEFGHAMGLGHSSRRGSVMHPYYGGYDANFHLGYDDIMGIYTKYYAH